MLSPSPLPLPPPSTWLLAVGISLSATLINNVGMLNMKKSMMSESLSDTLIDVSTSAWQKIRWRWVLGFTAYLVGQVFSMIALGFGPQSMMAALGAFSLVVNTFTSPCILGEVVTFFHVGATLVIISGVILVVCWSKKQSQHYSITDLEERFQQVPFLITAAAMVSLLFAMFVMYGPICSFKSCNTKNKKETKIENNASNDDEKEHEEHEEFTATGLPPIGCAFVAAVSSASTNLFAKCTMSILLAHNASEWYLDFTTWMIIGGLIVTAIGTVVFLNLGLNSKDGALFIIPVFFVMVLLCTTLVAAVFFGDFNSLPAFSILMLAIGAFLTLAGVYAIASHDVKNDPLEIEEEMKDPLLNNETTNYDTVNTVNNVDTENGERNRSRTRTLSNAISIRNRTRRASMTNKFTLNRLAYDRGRLGSIYEETVNVVGGDDGGENNGGSSTIGSSTSRGGHNRNKSRRESRRSRTYSANIFGFGVA